MKSARRREQRLVGIEPVTDATSLDSPSEDLRRLLHDEIGRLPDKYLAPVVLCHLEGKSHEEAARALRCPVGTLSCRLSRARELLRRRLGRRGAAVPVGAFLAVLETEATAATAGMLTQSAARIATRILSGDAPWAISAAVEALARDVAGTLGRRRFLTRVASVPLLACTSTFAVFWTAQRLRELPPAPRLETKIQRPGRGAAIPKEISSRSELELQLWLATSSETDVVLETQRGVVVEAIKAAARELEQARIADLLVDEAEQTKSSVKSTGDDRRRKIDQLNARVERLTTEAAELYVRWERNRHERDEIERALRRQD